MCDTDRPSHRNRLPRPSVRTGYPPREIGQPRRVRERTGEDAQDQHLRMDNWSAKIPDHLEFGFLTCPRPQKQNTPPDSLQRRVEKRHRRRRLLFFHGPILRRNLASRHNDSVLTCEEILSGQKRRDGGKNEGISLVMCSSHHLNPE